MLKDNPRIRDRLRTPRGIARLALAVFGVTAAAVTVIAIIESYSNLLAFARVYGLGGWRAAIAPGSVDSFIIMGELLLFAAIILAWDWVPHALGLGMAVWGFALSVGGNVWHAPSATIADRAVSAIWPVTATAGLAGALIIVRQIMKPPKAPGRVSGNGVLPVPDREEPRRVRPSRAAKPPGPAVLTERAWTAELTAAGLPLPSYRSWAHEKTGKYLTAASKRAYDRAREELASVNGGSHGDGTG